MLSISWSPGPTSLTRVDAILPAFKYTPKPSLVPQLWCQSVFFIEQWFLHFSYHSLHKWWDPLVHRQYHSLIRVPTLCPAQSPTESRVLVSEQTLEWKTETYDSPLQLWERVSPGRGLTTSPLATAVPQHHCHSIKSKGPSPHPHPAIIGL